MMSKNNNTKRHVSRRNFIKTSAISIGALTFSDITGIATTAAAEQNKAKVFFYQGYQR